MNGLPIAIPSWFVEQAIRETMAQVRADVAAGLGAAIEADAVLLGVAQGIARRMGDDFDEQAFLKACDLKELIPPEDFHAV
jgi:hypothetical protein